MVDEINLGSVVLVQQYLVSKLCTLMYIIYASYLNMKYHIRAKSCLPFSRCTASNINIETALNALQNLRREHVGASSLTTVSNPRLLVENVSDHGTIGPRKYFSSQKEKDQS